jgi:hypothetical protein
MPLQTVLEQIILKMEQITVPQEIKLKTIKLTTQQITLQSIVQMTLKINHLIQIIPILLMNFINIMIIVV